MQENAAKWNEEKAAECYRELRHVKNNYRREELLRNARRYLANAVGIRRGWK